jgi:copper chaperone NosL
MKSLVIILATVLLMTSCAIEPKEISYGKDACHSCKMNIVDQQHAAETVSKKGKVFKYDSIECMIRDNKNNNAEDIAMFLVMDYNNPNTFMDATKASYIISEKIPSPMGGFLSALKTQFEAEKLQTEQTGTLYNWDDIQKQF